MEVKSWAENEVKEQFSHCSTLKDVIEAVENAAETVGKVVCSISINGMRLSEKDEYRFSTTPTTDIKDIQVEIEDTGVLVTKTAISLRKEMMIIKENSVQIADEFREGDFSKAQRNFCSAMEQTQCIMDALRALKPRLRTTEESSDKWKNAEEQSQNMIEELMSAYSKKDYVLVADVLEYELHNTMESWIQVLDRSDFD